MAPFILAGFAILCMSALAGWALWTTYKLRLVMALAIQDRAREQDVAIGIDGGMPGVRPVRPTPSTLRQQAIDEAYKAVMARGHAASREEEELLGIN